jgi:hypothetical protein
MDNFLSLLRLALDRGWTLGGLFAIFFGGILFGTAYGLPVPAQLQEWSAAGLLFGIAVLFISLASHAAHGIGNLIKAWSFRRNLQSTLLALTQAEKEFLRPFIVQGENTQYKSIYDGVANGLQGKGIVYRASNLSVPGTPGMLFPWNLQPYARIALNKNRQLLD